MIALESLLVFGLVPALVGSAVATLYRTLKRPNQKYWEFLT